MLKSPDPSAHPAVLCRNVLKQFYVYSHRTTSLREWFVRTALRQPLHTGRPEFSLRDFNLQVGKGESVALIGGNGSGKSTVLRLLAGIYRPTAGTVTTSGRVAAVIELGAGFNTELTGAENVELYAAIMGLGHKELTARFDEIIEFSGIGAFAEMPVKYYSSGMQARLAFSVAVNTRPDILLLDEVLAVGDRPFQEKCIERLTAFQSKGGTMVVVSHNLDLVRNLCSRAVWLQSGMIRLDGKVEEVLDAYRSGTG